MVTFARYRGVFANAAFRRFWLGFSFSVLGDGITRVALVWFVYAETESARAVGWLFLFYTGPIVLGGLAAGMLLDRFDRRLVMLADNAVRGLVLALVPLLHFLDRLEVWHVYAVAAVYGLLMMISLAGGPALVPSLVPDEQLPTANALEMLSFTVGGVIGPPLAGVLIAAIGAPYVVLIDVLSYAAFAFALARIPPLGREVQTETTTDRPRLVHAVRLLLGNPVLLATTAMFLVFNIGGGMLAVWLPVLSTETLGGGAELYGLLLGVRAAGEVIAALLAGAVTPPLPLGTLICLAQAASGASLLILLGSEIVWVALGLLLFGACSAPLTIWAQTLRMRVIPERLRGRSFALLRTLMQSGGPLGGALGGLLLPAAGITAMIAASAAVVGVPGLAGLRVRALREADDRAATEPTLLVASEAQGVP